MEAESKLLVFNSTAWVEAEPSRSVEEDNDNENLYYSEEIKTAFILPISWCPRSLDAKGEMT